VEDLLINFLGIGEAENLFLRPALCNNAQGCRILDAFYSLLVQPP
jgi:hypothetical protein